MITSAAVNLVIRSQKCVKHVLACQRISSFHIRTQLQCQGVQDSSVTTSSVITFDTALGKTSPKHADILETKLSKAKSSDEVLQLAAAHGSIMNSKHISLAFSVFHDFIKKKPGEELFEATHSIGFQQLCKRIMRTAHHLTPDEAISVFKALCFLKVPSTAGIIQVLCQVLRQNINSLSLNQIVFLIFLLEKQHPTPLVEALLMGLPLVLQSQLDLQMDPENLSEMVQCLKVATTRKLSDAVIKKLSDAIHLKADMLTTHQAGTIIASLVPECQFPETFEQLVLKSFDILVDDIYNVDDREAMMLMNKLYISPFFSKYFLAALIDVALKRNWDLLKVSMLLSICEKFEFISEDLLHYTVCKMQSHATELCGDDRISLSNITGPFALVGYESTASNDVWAAVSNYKEKLETVRKKSPLWFLKINSELSILGGLPNPAVFGDDVLSSVSENIKKGRTRLARELCIIEWRTKIMNENFPGPYLPEGILQEAINCLWEERRYRNFPLKPFLKVGLGGDQFFDTNLMTKYGHAIDHIVLLRKGNYPIAIRRKEESVKRESLKTIKFVEDFIVPSESQILLIIVADEPCFCKNSSQLKGWVKFKLNTLSKLGYLPLLIKSETWKGLLDHEKIPYLMREINTLLKQSDEENARNAYPFV